jgi:site-specific DNA recombinase
MENTPPQYFRYIRKSSKGDEKQALSIESQREALDRFVRERGFTVVGEFIERESAHAPGRPVFGEMMRRIEAGEANGIIAWHPDRLSRNSKDGGEIIYFLDAGKLVDLKFVTFWFENTPQGKANLGHELVQTKQYSDKLGCDTKRGLQDKARMGLYPGLAPRGYLNDKATRTIVLDPTLAPVVKRAFELYAEGHSTLDQMQEFFLTNAILSERKGARGRGGLKVHHDWIRRFLRNPFYYGHFEYSGELYEGKHPPIITKRLFDEVQAVLEKRTKHQAPVRHPKPFAGLFQCGECGMAVTAEIQKGHTYYRCTRKSKVKACRQPFIREEALDGQLSALLLPYGLRSDWADQMLQMANNDGCQAASTSRTLIREKQAEVAKLDAKAQRLLDAYLEQLIDREQFASQKAEILTRKKEVREQITAFEQTGQPWLEPFQNWLKTAKNIGETVKKGSLSAKKDLAVNVFGSNLFLEGKKARVQALKPWSLLVETTFDGGMVPRPGIEPGSHV